MPNIYFLASCYDPMLPHSLRTNALILNKLKKMDLISFFILSSNIFLGAICSVELIIDPPNNFDDKYDVLSIKQTEISFPYSSREACIITRDLYRYYVNTQNVDTFERSASYPLEFKLRPYACFLFNDHSYIIAGKDIGNMEKETVY
jgi:hypothetical protein